MTADEILQSVVAKASPAERAEYLDLVCKSNAELRAVVEGLIASLDKAGSFLEQPLFEPSSTIDAPLHPEPLGTVIGPYKLMEQIGEGGMGLVYVAEQHHPVRRKVALKLIKPGMDTRQVIARFEAERQALALMDHPNIARVIDGGATASGRPYFVMELVRGVPITEYCDKQRLTPRARLELFRQVCAAVQHAHQKGIIHRDIKPSNVLVVSHDGTPVVKVIDFGVAKAIGQQLTEKTVYTQFAQFIGTPLYMSPEQAGESGIDIDTRSDVYALGVLLYELLTGATPFDRDRIREADYQEIRRIIREEEPPRPSTRMSTLNQQVGSTISAQRQISPRELSILLRGELDWIVMKSLEKDRNRRYESASALAADVGRYLKDEPVHACPPSSAYLVGKFLRRHRRGLLATAGLTIAILFVAGVGGWLMLDRAERQAETDRQRIATATAVEEDLKLAEIDQQKELWPNVRQALERAKGRLAESDLDLLKFKVDQRLREADFVAQLEMARMQASLVDFDDKIDFADVDRIFRTAFAANGMDVSANATDDVARRIQSSPIRRHLIAAMDYWAFIKLTVPNGDGEPLHAITRLVDNDSLSQMLRDPRVTSNREALEGLAAKEETLDQSSCHLMILAGLLAYRKADGPAIELLRSARKRNPSDFWINFDLANLLSFNRRHSEAVAIFRIALALQPRNAIVYNNLGYALANQNQFAEAAEAYLKAIELDPRSATAHSNLGTVYFRRQNLPEASAAFRKALELNPNHVAARNNLGATLAVQQKGPEAVEALERAIQRDPENVAILVNLGGAFIEQKKLPEAVKVLRRAIQLNAEDAGAHCNLGNALREQKKLPEAIAELRKALAIRSDFAEAHYNLANVLHDQGNLPGAISAYRKAIAQKHDYSEAYNGLGNAYLEHNRLPEAVTACQNAIELNPRNAEAHCTLGASLGNQNKTAEALRVLRKAVELKDDFAEAHNNIGELAARNGKPSEALRAYLKANGLKDLGPIPLYNGACVAVLVASGQGEDADKLDESERAQLRGQALKWLRAYVATYRQQMSNAPFLERLTIRVQLEHMLRDKDFNAVRVEANLNGLPEDERRQWQSLWQEVAEVLRGPQKTKRDDGSALDK